MSRTPLAIVGTEIRGNTPEEIIEEEKFERYKLIKRDVPPVKEWETFSGEGEYDRINLMEDMDDLQQDMSLPDYMITSRLGILFTGLATMWYIEKKKLRQLTWSQWNASYVNLRA